MLSESDTRGRYISIRQAEAVHGHAEHRSPELKLEDRWEWPVSGCGCRAERRGTYLGDDGDGDGENK